MTKSTLATQREQDEDLCGRLVRNSGYRNENWQCIVDPDFLTQAAARIRALSEALQEACHERDGLLAKVPEWQPIETAPKDGAQVLLAREFGWSTAGWWAEDDSEGDWYELNNHPSDSWGGPLARVSHWMPLPTPPGEK